MCGCRGWEDRHAPMQRGSEVVGWGGEKSLGAGGKLQEGKR